MSIAVQKKKINSKLAKMNSSQPPNSYERNDFKYDQYLRLFESLENEIFTHSDCEDLGQLKYTLDSFYRNLKTNYILVTDLSKCTSTSEKEFDVFLFQRARKVVKILSDFLVFNWNQILTRKNVSNPQNPILEAKDFIKIAIKVLKVFAIINPEFAKILAPCPSFVQMLLELILRNHKMYFKQSLRIMEAIISSNPNAIDRKMYPVISSILMNLPRKNFARFSRFVALLAIGSVEKTDFKELNVNFTESKIIGLHCLLLSVPNILESYTSILEDIVEIIHSLTSVTSENVKKTIKYLKESRILKNSGVNLDFLRPLFGPCHITENLVSEIFNPKFIVRFIVKKSNITELLFIVSNLLSGKRKIDVQDHLNQTNFFDRVVNPLFDILFNFELDLDNDEDSYSGATNPLTTPRVQLLKIILNFCDRDSSNIHNKNLFISIEEQQLLNKQVIQPVLEYYPATWNCFSQDPNNLSKILNQFDVNSVNRCKHLFSRDDLKENLFANVQNKGLLNKIITLLNNINGNSDYQFWLSSCVESFLRGSFSLHQIFVAHSGLVYSLLDKIISDQITKPNNIQIAYDLLGEIIKFNKYNMLFFENLCKKYEFQETLMIQVGKNVVDSNVFLRSIILSIEKFGANQNTENNLAKEDESRLPLSFYNSLAAKRFEWFNSLIEAVNPHTITQDNLCCINTALIISMFAEYNGNLSECLTSLLENKQLMDDFSKLLSIWQRFYTSKTKDTFSLQHATSIKLENFREMNRKVQAILKEHN